MSKSKILEDLRNQVANEDEPLAELLRKFLLLGAETGSESLKNWARGELSGYANRKDIPEYRFITLPSIIMTYRLGLDLVHNRRFSHYTLSREATRLMPEKMSITHGIEELEVLAKSHTVSLIDSSIIYAGHVITRENEFFEIMDIHWEVSGSTLLGMVGKVRTQMVEIIAELTSALPLDELPSKSSVDNAVNQYIHTQINTTIDESSGPVAIGENAKAISKGMGLDDVLNLLDQISNDAQKSEADTALKEEFLEVLEDFRSEIKSVKPTEEVVEKANRLGTLAKSIGLSGFAAATSGTFESLAEFAIKIVSGG